jgi:hypothetical protein
MMRFAAGAYYSLQSSAIARGSVGAVARMRASDIRGMLGAMKRRRHSGRAPSRESGISMCRA